MPRPSPHPGRATAGDQRWTLILRFVLLNATGIGIAAAVWSAGWLDGMIATDKFHLIKLNLALFLLGLVLAAGRALALGRELHRLRPGAAAEGGVAGRHLARLAVADGAGRLALAQALGLELADRLGAVRHVAAMIVLVGLVGTVIGFIIALSGIDPAAAGDAAAIGPMVATLLLGMSIALYKTLVGSILNLWLMLSHRLLERATIRLLTTLVTRGEELHARA